MRSFDDEQRCPAGPRWITQIRLGTAAQDLGDAYARTVRAWCGQQGLDPGVLRFVDRPFRHITLSLVDIPADDVCTGVLARLEQELADRLAGFKPFALWFGPAVVNEVAIELYVQPSPHLNALQNRVANAYRTVFPDHDPAPVGKTFRGHSAIAYCATGFPDQGLAGALLRTASPHGGFLGPATTVIEQVLLAPTDAWSRHGMWWDEARAREIPLDRPAQPAPPARQQLEWDAMQRLVEQDRRRQAWLLDWRDEIAAAARYARVPIPSFTPVATPAEHIIPRLGPELTAIARAGASIRRMGAAAIARDPRHPDSMYLQGQLSGAIEALETGLGQRLRLPFTESRWLAEALTGDDGPAPDLPST
ncbi:2'-5' RNA ligase family protein [Amycolatopsis roodepoortensis]|uniref:2'-5' RNA ligase family protein n=1 Tax=Amycolatopsis roodepoortensis TaxID=700274 RepID=UPI00214D0B6C|nr:2'-5' RNA ligase family protein [Amycolatopsis roodepoortensis]UUV32273.1 2'-5' RNA ligase family protein [Amycolatopsis roodepoortensis]